MEFENVSKSELSSPPSFVAPSFMFSQRSLPLETSMEQNIALNVQRGMRSFALLAIATATGCSSEGWVGSASTFALRTSPPAAVGFAAWEPQARTNSSTAPSSTAPLSTEIHAQGKLMPARGIARLSGMPGDRVESMLVKAGDRVRTDQPLATMQSLKIRSLELEALESKKREAEAAFEATLRELRIAVQAADAKVQAAKQLEELAALQKMQSIQSLKQVDALEQQIERLKRLRQDPLTRAAIGAMELETKQFEVEKARLQAEQAVQAANNQIEQSQLQTKTAIDAFQSAKETLDSASKNSPTLALEKQAEVLRMQVAEGTLKAPYDAIVLQVLTEKGERIANLPVVEIADVSKMVCVAEVYEADVSRVQVGDTATIRSSALTSELRGTVTRIDRVVGASQLRSPNPMARSDFRAIGVWIEIDPAQTEQAAERIQLQVDVTIRSKK